MADPFRASPREGRGGSGGCDRRHKARDGGPQGQHVATPGEYPIYLEVEVGIYERVSQ